jgi:hypothetical protein
MQMEKREIIQDELEQLAPSLRNRKRGAHLFSFVRPNGEYWQQLPL